jgi:hypothetical protein
MLPLTGADIEHDGLATSRNDPDPATEPSSGAIPSVRRFLSIQLPHVS